MSCLRRLAAGVEPIHQPVTEIRAILVITRIIPIVPTVDRAEGVPQAARIAMVGQAEMALRRAEVVEMAAVVQDVVMAAMAEMALSAVVMVEMAEPVDKTAPAGMVETADEDRQITPLVGAAAAVGLVTAMVMAASAAMAVPGSDHPVMVVMAATAERRPMGMAAVAEPAATALDQAAAATAVMPEVQTTETAVRADRVATADLPATAGAAVMAAIAQLARVAAVGVGTAATVVQHPEPADMAATAETWVEPANQAAPEKVDEATRPVEQGCRELANTFLAPSRKVWIDEVSVGSLWASRGFSRAGRIGSNAPLCLSHSIALVRRRRWPSVAR